MKMSLYTNQFMHEGVRHVSVCVLVRRDQFEIVGCYSAHSYATAKSCFDAACEARGIVNSTTKMLQALGHEVEVDDELMSINAMMDRLRVEALG